MKKLELVTAACTLAAITMLMSTQPVYAQQHQQQLRQHGEQHQQQRQHRAQRQQQHQPSWQPEKHRQPNNAHSGPDSNSWRQGLWVRMSSDEKDHIYHFVEDKFPRMFTELERLRGANQKRFENRMNRVVVEMQRLMEMVEIHPRRGALHIQERKFELELRFNIAKYRRSNTDNQKHRITSKMEQLIGQIFDTQTQRQELEVHELENRLTELTHRVKQRQAHRQEFIKKHLDRVRHGQDDRGGPPENKWLGEPGRP